MLAVEDYPVRRNAITALRGQGACHGVDTFQPTGSCANDNLKRGVLVARSAQHGGTPGTGGILRPHARKLIHTYTDINGSGAGLR